jgi:polyhydroxybutyrate depolymerase
VRVTPHATVRSLFVAGLLATGCFSLAPGSSDSAALNTILVDGRVRTFSVHTGPRFDRPLRPLLLVFHGLGGSAIGMEATTGLNGAADYFGFIVAYLDAAPGTRGSWALDCLRCTSADTMGISDLTFVDSVIARVSRDHGVDSTRVYVTGHSLGSYMAQVLACKRSSIVAAAAAVEGHMNHRLAAACPDPREPVPMLIVSGLDDTVMPWDGATYPNVTIFSADSTASFWATRNGCTTPPEDEVIDRSPLPGVTVRTFAQCAASAEVQRWGIDGLGHVWPVGNSFATSDIVRFLLRFARPSVATSQREREGWLP